MSTIQEKSPKAPVGKPAFINAVIIWMLERTPIPILLWGMLLYLVAAKMGQWSLVQQAHWQWLDIVGMLVMASYFILMRVLDEHKDFATDNALHPDRPVQRGVISLTQLKIVGLVCVIAQLLWSVYLDRGLGNVTLYWGLSMVWLALMTKEFFVEHWLRPRVMIYGISHMLIMCIVALWLMQMGRPDQWLPPTTQLPLLALFFLSSYIPEITRKTWGPEEERAGIDSYSEFFGARTSALVVLLLLWIMFVLKAFYFERYTGEWLSSFFYICLGLYLAVTAAFCLYIIKPAKTGRKLNEMAVGLGLLGSFVLLVIAVLG